MYAVYAESEKEEEAKQNTHENHTAEQSQKSEEARTRQVAKMNTNLVQNVLPEAPFWLSEGAGNAHEGKVGDKSPPNSSWEASERRKGKDPREGWRI